MKNKLMKSYTIFLRYIFPKFFHNLLNELFILFRMFSFGEFKAEDQEKMLQELNRKVEDVYKSCIGDNEAQIRQVNIQDKTDFCHFQLGVDNSSRGFQIESLKTLVFIKIKTLIHL